MDRYVCIHGHFYQPPRENPWLEAVELQDSAAPYHDWNERVSAECYSPNAVARILDHERWIERIVNNYARISFNFGPTLLSWLQSFVPDTYAAILAADRDSAARFSGHGSALAQAYNHMILPLANERDKKTQVVWGIRDFQRRFGRPPEGMWLPEAAVDVATLEALAAQGIAFTILAPHQARRIRRIGEEAWSETTGGGIDPSMAYRLDLPSGRSIVVFFYDGPISRAVAFEKLLEESERLAQRLTSAFSQERSHAQLVHIATDGETYGHHHPHGDMGLAYALQLLDADASVHLTNYGEFLAKHPPAFQAEIVDNTSWSCVHGVERWRSDCGCNSGSRPGWKQAWRAPLREALDALRDAVATRFEAHAVRLFRDPWAARDDYIDVVLDRSADNVSRFLAAHARDPLTADQSRTALKLLEIQRHAMLMYTSCGWFFDELSGLETVQVIQYAGRVLHLAREVFEDDVETDFLARLERAPSNLPEFGNGRQVYEKLVHPTMVDVDKVGAHYAISSLFSEQAASSRVYCYSAEREDHQVWTAGEARLVIGRARIASQITGDHAVLTYAVLHAGDHHLTGGVREYREPEQYAALAAELKEVFLRGDLHQVVLVLNERLAGSTYSLRSLFRDEQRRILAMIMDASLTQVAGVYRQVHDAHAQLLRFLADLAVPLPRSLLAATELTLNASVMSLLAEDRPDPAHLSPLLEEARVLGVHLDHSRLRIAARRAIDRSGTALFASPADPALVENLRMTVAAVSSLPFATDLWRVENGCHQLLEGSWPALRAAAEGGDPVAKTWVEQFAALARLLRIKVP